MEKYKAYIELAIFLIIIAVIYVFGIQPYIGHAEDLQAEDELEYVGEYDAIFSSEQIDTSQSGYMSSTSTDASTATISGSTISQNNPGLLGLSVITEEGLVRPELVQPDPPP